MPYNFFINSPFLIFSFMVFIEKIKNSDIEKISNIKITGFNDADYGFLMLEIDENKILNFDFKYN